jgi:predicted Ser/Thr protein kinase
MGQFPILSTRRTSKRKRVSNQSSIIKAIQSIQAPSGMTTKIIAIDGPGGAGKSSFAEQLSQQLGNVPIIHTDDFASWENPLNWAPIRSVMVRLKLRTCSINGISMKNLQTCSISDVLFPDYSQRI